MEPKPTRCWLRPVSRAARVGEHTAVTWNRLYVMPMSCTRLKAGVLTGPPKESMEPKPASSMRTTSTLGASSGALGPGMNAQSATESLSVRPAVPPKVLSGIGSTVRSGTNLPAASASASFRPLRPCLSMGATDLAGEPARACSASSRCGIVDDRDDGGRAGLELLAEALFEPAVDFVLGELADDAACGRAHCGRGQQRRSREADQHSYAAAPAHALTSEVVARLRDADLAALVVLDEDEPLALDLLVLDELHQPVEVLLGRLDGLIAGHDERECVTHWSLLALRWVGRRSSGYALS